jgi:ADP-ribosylglycohydrolase
MHNASEDQFLGALLGLAIGDALGMPVAGYQMAEIAAQYGQITTYLPKPNPDGPDIEAGEFTDETEVVLAIVEAATTTRGQFDPELIGPRLVHLAQGDSAHWLGAETRAALERAAETLNFAVAVDEDGPATGDVALRGVPVGLMASVGRFDPQMLWSDSDVVTRLTHTSPAQTAAVSAVAYAVQLAARATAEPGAWLQEVAAFLEAGSLAEALIRASVISQQGARVSDVLHEIGTGPDVVESVPAGIAAAALSDTFEEAVLAAVNAGGATDTVAALAGALAGAHRGASDIPQALIDGLGGRIYVSLAAPWFRRAAMSRAGLTIDLWIEGQRPPESRPQFPPGGEA